jgi:hypothetical protein
MAGARMTDFRIRLAREHLAEGSPEERAAFGHVVIHAGQTLLSEGFDNLVDLRRDGPLASGYHLAEWFLWNWWRLRYEPRPNGPSSADWRQSHCMAEIGEGYVWPNVTIVSDGQRTVIQSAASERGEISSFRYYGAPHPVLLAWSDVEAGIDAFVQAVMAGVADEGVRNTNLDRLWNDLAAERRDREIARYRRFEALLGADPDELPEDAIANRLADTAALGEGALDELAAAATGSGINAVMTAEQALANARIHGVEMRIADAIARDEQPAQGLPRRPALAASVGVDAARWARRRAGLRGGAIDDARLAEIAGVSSVALRRAPERLPISFTLNDDQLGERLVLGGKGRESRRFHLARLIGDRLMSGDEPMRPSTEAKTYRQKAQRAFAAEFLAPIDAVMARAEGDYSDDAKEEIARYFRVSSMVIDSLLKNNGVIPRDADDFADVA